MSRTRSGASSKSPHPDRGERWIAGPSVPRLRLLVQLINGVPGPGESTHLVVPGMRTLLQRLRIHLGEVFRPIRDVYRARSSDPRPAKIRTSPTRLLIIQRRTESCTSGSLVSRPTGVADGLSGPSAPELVTPSARLGGWWAAYQGPRHLGAPHQSPPPLAWGSLSGPADLTGGPPERDSYPAR